MLELVLEKQRELGTWFMQKKVCRHSGLEHAGAGEQSTHNQVTAYSGLYSAGQCLPHSLAVHEFNAKEIE